MSGPGTRDVNIGWPGMGIPALSVIAEKALTISTSAVGVSDAGFTAPQIAAAEHMMLTFESGAIRFRRDGTAVTNTTGDYTNFAIEWMEPGINYKGWIANLSMIRDNDETEDVTAHISLYH